VARQAAQQRAAQLQATAALADELQGRLERAEAELQARGRAAPASAPQAPHVGA